MHIRRTAHVQCRRGSTYFNKFLEQPVASSPWMIQFGGHHLGLNVTFVGDKAVCAPFHTGVLPSKFVKNGKTIRGLGRENDEAFDLVATLTSDQLKAATIDHDVSDLVFGPGHPTRSSRLRACAAPLCPNVSGRSCSAGPASGLAYSTMPTPLSASKRFGDRCPTPGLRGAGQRRTNRT
jgi:hypothetical protein